MKVFLGGTCNGDNWRDSMAVALNRIGVDSFNPVVEDWNEEAQAREIREREECDFCLYTVTPKMTGVYSIAEVVEDSIKRPGRVIFNVIGETDTHRFSEVQIKSLIAVGQLVTRNGGIFCASEDKVVEAVEVMAAIKDPSYLSGSNTSKKTLHNSPVSGARQNVKDIKVVGNGDMFQLLYKVSSEKEGWMKSTKAMQVGDNCLVQVTTQQRNPDGSYAIAEALTLASMCYIKDDINGGRKLVNI